MVAIASVHGIVYERLYSPGSFKHSSQQRLEDVQELTTRLETISKDNSELTDKTVYRRQYMSFLVRSNSVVIGCLQTLVYRAVIAPIPEMSIGLDPRCLLAARATIHSHLDMMAYLQFREDGSADDYVSWAVLNCPFTPFIVVFYSVVKTPNLEDLELLESFAKSLQATKFRCPDNMQAFQEMCQAFSSLARQYVTASISEPEQNVVNNQITAPDDNFDITLPDDFEDWFSGAQYIIEYESTT
ncbi:hypothetical protein E4T48_06473 [Aureobasidium sp. EXF-10727]|nr:hypothetical protein E4T48_06473 [Aureobasidium sp. EXF-10727]